MPKLLNIIGLLSIVIGLCLSIVAWLELCSSQCVGTQYYRIFGIKFQIIGILFFITLIFTHLMGRKREIFRHITSLLLASALGAEVVFILIQKYTIQQWCPVCLGIATTVLIAGGAYLANFLSELNKNIKQNRKGEIMQKIWRAGGNTSALVLGFLIAFLGTAKSDPLEAKQDSIREALVFGKLNSPIELYLFTDWQCPACRKLEPELEKLIPAVTKNAQFVFVDYVIHPETLNFIPYNMSFMINNKEKYIGLRDDLTEISIATGEPSQEEIEEIAAVRGIEYEPLNYADVAVGRKYFQHLATEFSINATPTLVIVNRNTKKGKKLYGPSEITTENVEKAIIELKTP